MKIIQTSKAYYPLIGGIETIITTLSEGLSLIPEADVHVLVCNNEQSLMSVNKIVRGVRVTYLPTFWKVASLPLSPTYFCALRGVKADVLHIHQPFPLADLSLVLQPSIWKNFRKIVVSWHSDIVRQKWILAAYRPLLHKFLERVDKIIVATPHHIDSSEFLSNYRTKCSVIPYGVDLEWTKNSQSRTALVQSFRERFGVPLVLFVGRLVYYKGLTYLIEALKEVADAHLLIVGAGPLHHDLENQIHLLGLQDRVKIIPPVSVDHLHALYEAADVFVLPSTEPSEAFGIVQVEAMVCGKPVITTNIGTGVTYVNQHGITGLTVPPRDPDALGKAINALLHNDELRLSYGRNARIRATSEFTSQAMIDRIWSLYKRIL